MIQVYRNPITLNKISIDSKDANTIKILYESNTNTNEFNDLEKIKVNNYPQIPSELHINGGVW